MFSICPPQNDKLTFFDLDGDVFRFSCKLNALHFSFWFVAWRTEKVTEPKACFPSHNITQNDFQFIINVI